MTTDKKVLKEMLEAACHFGHKSSAWNPKMHQYLYVRKDGIHIFDLTKTYDCLMKALNFLKEQASEGKTILLVSTKMQAIRFVTEVAKKCGCPYVTRKWMPGLLTNFDTIKKRIKYFRDLKEQKRSGGWDKYTKKEKLELDRVSLKLEDAFSGVEDMIRLPDVVVVFDCVRDVLALREARRLNLTTIGVCDSNSDPDLVEYPIPGNDDAIKSLKYFIESVGSAIEAGKKVIKKAPPEPVKTEAKA